MTGEGFCAGFLRYRSRSKLKSSVYHDLVKVREPSLTSIDTPAFQHRLELEREEHVAVCAAWLCSLPAAHVATGVHAAYWLLPLSRAGVSSGVVLRGVGKFVN